MNFSGVVLSVFLNLSLLSGDFFFFLHFFLFLPDRYSLFSQRTQTDLAKLNDTSRLKTQEDEEPIAYLFD